ncbi:hypothetical protein ACFL6M_05570 [Candidatus Eisenbacteria bacterium]|uniref:Uncharacterized protein n=1 Tax=Eiseniibacteriota bacterium TaxID=2212470 RepID=A0ABV6YL41_UNCEI
MECNCFSFRQHWGHTAYECDAVYGGMDCTFFCDREEMHSCSAQLAISASQYPVLKVVFC